MIAEEKMYFSHYRSRLTKVLHDLDVDKLLELKNILLQARDKYKTIFIMGNGGSSATASHFAGDLSKEANVSGKARFKAISLTDNTPNVTQWSNDINYDNVFLEQLKNLLEIGDIVIGISGSGESKNVINAIQYANSLGAKTVGFSGFQPDNSLSELVNLSIHVPINNMQIVEDSHLIIEHMITLMIKLERR